MVKKGYRQTPEHIQKRMTSHPQKNQLLTCRACKIKVPREQIKENSGFCDKCFTHVKLCDCGCEEEMFKYTKKGKIAQFMDQGHHNKVVGKKIRQQAANDPEYAAHISKIRSQAAKKLYQDNPELRNKRREQMKTRYEDPEEVEKTRQQQVERWSDPEEREKQSQRQLDFIEQNPEITESRVQVSREYWSDEDARELKSEQVEKLWQDREFKETQRQARIGNTNAKGNRGKPKSEEHKRKIGASNKITWSDPKLRASKSGANNPNWKNGISFEPYDKDFDDERKEQMRKRQNYICADEDETCNDYGEHLSVHHIDENKKNSHPSNLIALCRSHHSKSHTPEVRKRYEAFVQSLITKEAD